MTELPANGLSKPIVCSTMSTVASDTARRPVSGAIGSPHLHCRSPVAITFVRHRMFYARAALNAKAKVTFGLRHIREP